MNYVYGPVSSRRLGISLGVDVIPPLRCTFDCVYCELEKRTRSRVSGVEEIERNRFPANDQVLAEVRDAVEECDGIDYIAFSGSGEPTLNPDLGKLWSGISDFTDIPLALITNSSLLSREDVLERVSGFDLILPSLDAGDPELFRSINRPADNIELEEIVNGIRKVADSSARVWLEVMLINSDRFGNNTSRKALSRLGERINYISPRRVHLNTPVRSSVKEVGPLSKEELRESGSKLERYLDGGIELEIIEEETAEAPGC